MTVAELLERIAAAYSGATPEAMKTFKPVFYARLRKHEGDILEAAAVEVLGTFRPKFDQKFPIPADFEAHLPSGKLHMPDEGDGIRRLLEQRAQRSESLYRDWHANQGRKIKEARPLPVYGQCVLMAKDLANNSTERTPRIVLTAEQIAECDQRAVSAARVAYGKLPKDEDIWREQIARIRESWAAT